MRTAERSTLRPEALARGLLCMYIFYTSRSQTSSVATCSSLQRIARARRIRCSKPHCASTFRNILHYCTHSRACGDYFSMQVLVRRR